MISIFSDFMTVVAMCRDVHTSFVKKGVVLDFIMSTKPKEKDDLFRNLSFSHSQLIFSSKLVLLKIKAW